MITFLPILVVFFAALALLEDTGYFARAAYVMDRYMHHLGLMARASCRCRWVLAAMCRR